MKSGISTSSFLFLFLIFCLFGWVAFIFCFLICALFWCVLEKTFDLNMSYFFPVLLVPLCGTVQVMWDRRTKQSEETETLKNIGSLHSQWFFISTYQGFGEPSIVIYRYWDFCGWIPGIHDNRTWEVLWDHVRNKQRRGGLLRPTLHL